MRRAVEAKKRPWLAALAIARLHGADVEDETVMVGALLEAEFKLSVIAFLKAR